MRAIAGLLIVVALTASQARAQSLFDGRAAIEAVAAVASTSTQADDPFVWLDAAATIHVNETFAVLLRPYARRLPGGDWDALLYQAQIRYLPVEGVRVDAGIITSPMGLGALELRPDLNPVVTYPFYYFGSLPRFDEYTNGVQLLSGGYPLGAIVSWSRGQFDLRAGVTDSTPARGRDVLEGGPASSPQLIVGGGITPVTGLRIGAAVARGRYREESDDRYFQQRPGTPPITNADAVLFNFEGEYSFRHTRLSGEWIRDRFDSTHGGALARGFYLQGVQTITPRVFAAARLTHASTPVDVNGLVERRSRAAIETTAGYRLTPALTLKAGHQASRAFGESDWSHAAVWSIVWSERWF